MNDHNDDESRIENLRARAQEILESGDFSANTRSKEDHLELESLNHELRIYDAELTLQNQQLRQNEQALSAALNRFEVLFESLPLASIVVNKLGVITQANNLAADLFNFRNKSVIQNHSLLRLISKHDSNLLYNQLNKQSVDRVSQLGPVILASDPQYITDFYMVQLPEEFHLDRHILITIIDRTEYYEQDRKLKLLKLLVDNTDSRIFAFDHNNRCIFANSKELEMLNMTSDEVIGARRDMWMPSNDALKYERQDALAFTTRQNYIYEENSTTENNTEEHFITHKFPLTDEHGVTFGIGGISTEITQSKLQTDRLNLAMVAYSMGQEGILITDEDNLIISVNNAFNKITGFSEEEVLGKDPRLLASGRHTEDFFRHMWESINRDGSWEGEIWNRRKNGDVYPQWLKITRVAQAGNSNISNYIAVFSDLSKRKLAEQEIEKLAFYDGLTGLPNRFLLADRVQQLIASANRSKNHFALIFFDLDRFKQINDVHGHSAGDEVLVQISRRANHLIREKDTFSRLSGDEFVMVLNDIDKQDIRSKIGQLIRAISEPCLFQNTALTLSASLGIAIYPDDGDSFETLLKNADTAMYAAKERGRNTYEFFNREMAETAKKQLQIEFALRKAIKRDELHLVYQPQYDLSTQKINGAEALLRWQSKSLGRVSPAVFIPIAEQSGIIKDIGSWVLSNAFRFAQKVFQHDHDITIAINISVRQFEGEDFIQQLSGLLEETGIEARRIELEITESVIMEQPEWSTQLLKQLKKLGFKLSLDDFGTGYSSMSYLRWMPIDIIKIDQSFVSDLKNDPNDQIICQSIINLAHSFGLKSIAEGIETEDSLNFLKDKGCDMGQGYFFSAPVLPDQLLELLK